MTTKKYYEIGKKKLFKLNRSLTGDGNRKTLNIIKSEFKEFKIQKIKSGKKVFDWKIPPEWNIKKAHIIDKKNKKILDFKNNNLHIVGYSQPINKFLKKDELLKHIHSLPRQPKAIPYVTSYYNKYWGFCMSHLQKNQIKKYRKDDKFKVLIDSKFNNKGFLNYGEILLKGNSNQEILVSTFICHPSMANNELSGPIVSMSLINHFRKIKKLSKSIRFIFIPETIGSIAYLSKNLSHLKKNVIGGFNLSCIGDERNHSCMFTKYNDSPSDKALREAYLKLKIKYKTYSFLARGSDERQYNSPGVDLPITSIFRTKYGNYPEYHISLDNFDIVTQKGIAGGFKIAKKAIEILQKKVVPKNKFLCEPQMGKRNLYVNINTKNTNTKTIPIMDFLQYADGKNDLNDISKKIKIKYKESKKLLNILLKNKLITI